MRKLVKKIFSLSFLMMAFIIFSNVALAQSAADPGNNFGSVTALSDADPRIIIARVLQFAFGFLGIVFLILILYAGFIWMTSEGNSEKIDKAKKILTSAVIGLIIMLSAFSITSFILNKLYEAAGGIDNGGSPGGSDNGRGISAAANSVIETHYPARGQENIPRNTKIIITFKEVMARDTIINGSSISNNIKILRTENFDDPDPVIIASSDVKAESNDNKTFVLTPVSRLDKNQWYTVELTSGVKKAGGENAFSISEGYNWNFEIGDSEDSIPPKIESVIPSPNSTEPRNAEIQINFNEPIDPTTILGSPSFITVNGGAITGNFYVSNNYRTVEFLSENNCGKNSCGQDIYCLPGNANVDMKIFAAALDASAGGATAQLPYNGLVDLAGNSFDGNGDGIAQGRGADDYGWSFKTSNEIINNPPKIISYKPAKGEGASLTDPVEATFDHYISGNSLIKNNTVKLNPNTEFFDISMNNTSGKSTVFIRHYQFNNDTSYTPEFTSGIKDIYQNCFTPCAGPEL